MSEQRRPCDSVIICRYDDDTGKWVLPQLKMEQTQLPSSDDVVKDNEDEMLYRRLARKPDPTQDFFLGKKTNALLNQRYSPNGSPGGYVSANNSNAQRFGELQYDMLNNYQSDLRAAEVHGQMQLSNEIASNRRPVHRLEALSTGKKSRKKNSKYTPDNLADEF